MSFHTGEKVQKKNINKPQNSGKSNDPQAVKTELGVGKSIDSSVRSRMESAFGMDFSHVRTHTDSTAAGLSDNMNARAFTVGEHVAFGSGEYRPGTLIGDALIAHELSHVVQQRGGDVSAAPMQGGDATYNNLEEDADKSAVSAIVSLWGEVKGTMVNIAKSAIPQLRTGVRLQRCRCTPDQEAQANAAFRAVVGGVTTGRRQPIPIPFPDPNVARGMLEVQYGIIREDFMMWQADGTHSYRWEHFYGTNYIDWSAYQRYGDDFGQIWPHFLRDAWNHSIPRERAARQREGTEGRSP